MQATLQTGPIQKMFRKLIMDQDGLRRTECKLGKNPGQWERENLVAFSTKEKHLQTCKEQGGGQV